MMDVYNSLASLMLVIGRILMRIQWSKSWHNQSILLGIM
jgi:hypothetical protein